MSGCETAKTHLPGRPFQRQGQSRSALSKRCRTLARVANRACSTRAGVVSLRPSKTLKNNIAKSQMYVSSCWPCSNPKVTNLDSRRKLGEGEVVFVQRHRASFQNSPDTVSGLVSIERYAHYRHSTRHSLHHRIASPMTDKQISMVSKQPLLRDE